MSNGYSPPEVHVERIDADAVCAQCGSVNPEDTLLCKTCGNNLRDQRARRVASEHSTESAEGRAERKSIAGKLLVLLGILLIVWTALNLHRIENIMVSAQTDTSNGERFWVGADNKTFDEMRSQLQATPVSEAEATAAEQSPVNDGVLEGRYAIIGANIMGRRVFIGQVIVRQDAERLLFVALNKDGSCEVRGEGRDEGENRLAAREAIGIKVSDAYYGGTGLAQRGETGGYECFGNSDYDNQTWSVTAYKIPQQ